MLKLYDSLHQPLQPLTNYQGLYLKKEVNGEDSITFKMPITELNKIREEFYIRTPDNEYIVKELSINSHQDEFTVTAYINVEELKGTPVKYFETIEKTPSASLGLALSYCPGGWGIRSSITKRRTLRQSQKTVWDIIKQALNLYMAEIRVDSINKIIYFESTIGEDKGCYFMEQLNLKTLNIESDTYGLVTRIYPVGADGLTIEEVNDGLPYVDNNTYSNKILAMYWEDNRYTVAENLRDDAIEKLETLAKPSRSYQVEVIDLATIANRSVLDYDVGDTVWLKDSRTGTNEKHRIVSLKSYPEEPENNTATLSTNLTSLVSYMDDSLTAYEAVQLVVTQDGRIDSSKVDGGAGLPPGGTYGQVLAKAGAEDYLVHWVDQEGGGLTIEEIEAQIEIKSHNIQDGAITSAKIGEAAITDAHISDASITRAKIAEGAIGSAEIGIGAIKAANIENGTIESANIKDGAIITAKIADGTITTAKIGTGEIKTANIEDGAITRAKIKDLAVDSAKIADGAITQAKIGEAAITTAHIGDGQITTAKIGDASITAAKIQDASITSAKILELDAGLIRSGTLETERLLITGESADGTIKSIVLTLNTINGTDQLSKTTIDGGSITKRTISADHIIANSITGNEIQANSIDGDRIKAGSITAQQIEANSISIGKIDPAVIADLKDYTDKAVTAFGEYLSFNQATGLTIGSNSTNFKTVIGSSEMGFYNGSDKVAYINGSEFNITNGKILNRLQLGHYVFVPRDSGNLSIVWED